MEITKNKPEFDKRQIKLIREIIVAVKNTLAESSVSLDEQADLTGDIAFSIASIIDGSRVMQADGRPLVPVLAFAENAQRTKLLVTEGGSFMHEYVFSTVDDVYDADFAC